MHSLKSVDTEQPHSCSSGVSKQTKIQQWKKYTPITITQCVTLLELMDTNHVLVNYKTIFYQRRNTESLLSALNKC